MAYERHSILSLSQVFDVMTTRQRKLRITPEIQVGVSSLRLKVFHTHGTTCAHCHAQATFFAVERPVGGDKSSWHLNLYGENDLLFTHDHVHPKSKGGESTIENAQTLCRPCNAAKSDTVTL